MKYEMRFLEMGKKGDHVHFLIQSIPSYSSTKIATKFKSISPEIYFLEFQEKTNQLWGREFWKDGYFVSIVGEHTKEIVIREYIKNQGKHC